MSVLRRKHQSNECHEAQDGEQETVVSSWGKQERRKKKRFTTRGVAVILMSCLAFLILSSGSTPLQHRLGGSYIIRKTHSHLCTIKNTFDRASKIGCKIEAAISSFELMVERQSRTVEEASAKYQERYNRLPPPGFEKWVEFALLHNSTIIDDYDQIDIDLQPFRGYSPEWLRRRIAAARASWPTGQLGSINVFDGILKVDGNRHLGALSASTLEDILQPIASNLPDLEVLFNWYAEPRVRVDNRDHSSKQQVDFLDYSQLPTWDFVTATCPNNTMHKSDFTTGNRHQSNICKVKPELELYHGFFNAPNQFRPTEDLVPMLSRAKLSTFQDMLIPNVCYANADWRLFGVRDHKPFTEKKDSLYWRGSSTGQQKTQTNWATSHRVRFIRYMQWLTKMSLQVQLSPEVPNGMTASTARSLRRLGPSTFNAGFTLFVDCEKHVCDALQTELGKVEIDSPSAVFDHKFLFDTDGQSMSCRFYRLLETNSIVFKSTIWNEWHGERLVPWLHYVPVSVKLQEIPQLIDYFVNNKRGKEYAEIIAAASRSWSEESLRVIDLTIYYYRLLLEFGALLNESPLL